MNNAENAACTECSKFYTCRACERAGKAISGGLSLPANPRAEAEDEFHAVHSRNPKDWNRAMNRDDA